MDSKRAKHQVDNLVAKLRQSRRHSRDPDNHSNNCSSASDVDDAADVISDTPASEKKEPLNFEQLQDYSQLLQLQLEV